MVDALFVGASERLWALTSKTVDVYEFEVLSLREYFAARFLFNNAGEEDRRFDSTHVLRELLRRPYWLNTARFYGGNAHGNDVYTLTAGIEEELGEESAPASYLAAWALLTDGVFQQRPREARKVLTALCSDYGLHILLAALDRRDITPLRTLPSPPDDGPDPTWARLTALIQRDPADPANGSRVRALRDLLPLRTSFDEWWYEQFTAAIGEPLERAWLQIGAECEAGAGYTCARGDLALTDGGAQLFLNTGLAAPAGSALESALMQAVLDGECPSSISTKSMPAQIAIALAPAAFFTRSKSGFTAQSEPDKRRRAQAITQLRRSESPYAAIAERRSFVARQHGNTTPWVETASTLYDHAGPCWLASEITVIGAASPYSLSYVHRPGRSAFGPDAHPSELLAQLRRNGSNVEWWRTYLNAATDDLARAEWALAMWCIASAPALTTLLATLDETIRALPEPRRRTFLRAAEQATKFGWLRGRGFTGTAQSDELTHLICLRSAPDRSAIASESPEETSAIATLPSLLSVARTGNWLKVDSAKVYR
ncbi:MAG TPA: hypothetical protein VN035_11670 [Microbacterium sp.]|nr:hypothetical protein [Microbacterium sp.]